MFHTRTVVSSEAEANIFPSRAKATALTFFVWGEKTITPSPELGLAKTHRVMAHTVSEPNQQTRWNQIECRLSVIRPPYVLRWAGALLRSCQFRQIHERCSH